MQMSQVSGKVFERGPVIRLWEEVSANVTGQWKGP